MFTFCHVDKAELKLHIGLLAVIISISLLLTGILIIVLTKFGRKPSSNRQRRRDDDDDDDDRQTYNLPSHIVHTELDLDNPYASLFSLAPPSYAETLLADQRVQPTLANGRSEDGESSNFALMTGEDSESMYGSVSNMTPDSPPPIA